MNAMAGGRGSAALGLTMLRVVVGVVFVAHGAQKLLVFGQAGVTDMLAKLGFPMPAAAAVLLIALELLGGLALALGVLTRLTAALLAIEMLVAFALVHASKGFFLPMGFEFVMTLFGALVALLLAGPGALAADNALFRRRGRL